MTSVIVRYKCPIMRGEMDPLLDKHEKFEELLTVERSEQCVGHLLSLDDVELSVTDGEAAPPHHSVSGHNGTPQEKQLEHQDHSGSERRFSGQYGKHTLVHLNNNQN